jgi:hypothetical protein
MRACPPYAAVERRVVAWEPIASVPYSGVIAMKGRWR